MEQVAKPALGKYQNQIEDDCEKIVFFTRLYDAERRGKHS